MSIPLPPGVQGPWCQVMIATTNEDGIFIRDDEGEVIERPRLLDVRTGDFYVEDTAEDVWGKCAAIPFGLPLYTAGQMIWSFGRFFVDIPAIALGAIRDFVSDWQKGHTLCELGRDYAKKITCDIPASMGKNVLHFIAAPFLAGGVLATAAYGIISPYEGRKWEAKVELCWENDVSFKEDVRWKGLWNARACYLAHCFQPRGNIESGKYVIRHWEWQSLHK
jgi:hypothetical protein